MPEAIADSSDPEPTFEDTLAWSMDAEPALLPHLPELFADLEELGCKVGEVLPMLRQIGLDENSRVLDLGCGKGAVAIAIAKEFGCAVHAVDGMAAFVEHAERRAEAEGVAESCIFAEADVHVAVAESRDYDLVCMLALGDVFGCAEDTVEALRACVKPGGYILIDDAYLRDGAAVSEDLIDCYDHAQTVELLCSKGDELVAELVIDGPESRAGYEAMTAAVATRAAALAKRFPDDADLLLSYVARQEAEVEILAGPIVGALWLLRHCLADPAGLADPADLADSADLHDPGDLDDSSH